MTPPVDKILGCPACGMRVTGLENSCPRCGKKFDASVKFECPFCGELILIGSKICPLCRLNLTELSDKVQPQVVEKTMDQLLTEIIEIESTKVKREDKRFSCPKCSWLLDGSEQKCPKCGQIVEGKLGLQCPVCGTPVDRTQRQCPRCGISLVKVADQAKPMVPIPPAPTPKPAAAPVPAPLAPKPALELEIEELDKIRTCPVCGATSLKDSPRCPQCNTSFVDERPKIKMVVQVPEPKKVSAEDALASLSEIEKQALRRQRSRKLRSDIVTPSPVKPIQVEKGLSNGLGRVNGRVNGLTNGRTNGRVNGMTNGRINGVSMVNGRGRVNGKGAVNGKSLVNGTGISNGLRSRTRDKASRRTMFLTRWQFLAVLVAIAIVLPTFVYLSYSKKSEKFAVDGDFSEWDKVSLFGARIQSTSARNNIIEWSVTAQANEVFFYLRTQTRMMSSPEAESFYIFADSDGSSTSGYVVEELGADFMAQLTGWDNAIQSSSLSEYSSSTDHYDWSSWRSTGSLSVAMEGSRLEGAFGLPSSLSSSAKFLLLSKDSSERGSVGYVAPAQGGTLIVSQQPTSEVSSDGIVPKADSVAVLRLNFTCEGAGGHVNLMSPTIVGGSLAAQIPSFSIDPGEEHVVDVSIDTSDAADGQLVSAAVLASGISSDFRNIEILGDCANAYAVSPPAEIMIDGAFADWEGRLSADQDSMQSGDPNSDISEVGNVSTTESSYFYVSVEGDICSGTFVPAYVLKPSGSGGGVVVPTRHTAEDTLRIYVDTDKSSSSGYPVSLNSKLIGADHKIELKGLFGKITSSMQWTYSSGSWVQDAETINAAKDSKRIEIGVSASSLGGSSDINFIVETTTWKGSADMATYDPATVTAFTRSWVVDSSTTSISATAMSYQRKLFYDGTNIWSFYYDGSNTVCRYSNDGGISWVFPSLGTRPFTNDGVANASIWYDSAVKTVYVVGDPNTSSTAVYVRMGVVDSLGPTITWSGASDSTIAVSSNPTVRKNTFICKDTAGYLWVLSSMKNGTGEVYDLAAFRSDSVNSTSPWTDTGHLLNATYSLPNAKGSILPAGTGSQVWAVYGYDGKVASRKYDGSSWQVEEIVYGGGASTSNTDNSPPCALVDDAGVVHVVFGDGTKKSDSRPQPYHAARDSTAWSNLHSLYIPTGQEGCYYPTISLDKSTSRLYAFWILDDGAKTRHWTVTGKYNTTSDWTSWGTSTIYNSTDTTSQKQYLNSIYSAPTTQLICFQWTQNATVPDLEVIFDKIPEFGDIVLPIIGVLMIIAIFGPVRRKRDARP